MGLSEMERQTDRAENLLAKLARITMSLTQAAAAIVAPLRGWLPAEDSNPVFQMAYFNDLATDWHSF